MVSGRRSAEFWELEMTLGRKEVEEVGNRGTAFNNHEIRANE